MSYPILPDKYKLAPLLTAESMIEFRRKYGGLGDLPAPHSAWLRLYRGASNSLWLEVSFAPVWGLFWATFTC